MAHLLVVDGPNAGTVFPIEDECILGRAADCHVVLQDLTVSRRHARILRSGGAYAIEHVSAVNQTIVNGSAVMTSTLLRDGDVIQVGGISLRFSAKSFAIAAATTVLGSVDQEPQIVRKVSAKSSILDGAGALTSPAEFQKMADRLKTVNAVSKAIAHILDPQDLLPEILRYLLSVFPDAMRSSVLLQGDVEGEMIPKAVRCRRERDHREISVPKTILRQVLTEREAVLSRDAKMDDRFQHGLSVQSAGVRSMMCAPMIWRNETLGVIYLDCESLGAFAQTDLELLNGIADQAATAVGVAHLHSELMRRQRLDQDLELAERIQKNFLPQAMPSIAGYDFAASYTPAGNIGGDFYDFIDLPSGRLAIVAADVSGKGVGAALYMSRLTRDLRFFALSEPDPGCVLQKMNGAVLESGQDNMFLTMVYVLLDAPKGELTIANAGHMPPIVRHKGEGRVDVLEDVSSLPLGILPDSEFEVQRFLLEGDDTVMLFTDGLVEAMSPSREMFGMERLRAAISRGPSRASAMLERAITEMHRHVAGAPQFDDTTVVCMGRGG